MRLFTVDLRHAQKKYRNIFEKLEKLTTDEHLSYNYFTNNNYFCFCCMYQWIDPGELLAEHSDAKIWLAPPQIYELRRLCNFDKYDDLKRFCAEREQHGCVRWLPVRMTFKDGVMPVLPGRSQMANCKPLYVLATASMLVKTPDNVY
jgi:hypothetical protein